MDLVKLSEVFCNWQQINAREDIEWDVDNIIHENNITKFDISEFEQPLETKEQVALYTALRYSTHFKELYLSKYSISKDAATSLLLSFKSNSEINTLHLEDIGSVLNVTMPILNAALIANPHNQLTTITLPNNQIDDKALGYLSDTIGRLNHGLIKLDLSRNMISKKGINELVNKGFEKNKFMVKTLNALDLSHNKIGVDGSHSLGQWLSKPNVLRGLKLDFCNISFKEVCVGLARGCLQLEKISFSGNRLAKGDETNLVTFFGASPSLLTIHLNRIGCEAKQLRSLIKALASNTALRNLELHIGHNNLGVVGGNLLAQLIPQLKCVARLTCHNNNFGDKGLEKIFTALAKE